MPSQVHLLLNLKGGVGKTTLAVNLAAVTYDVFSQNVPRSLAAAADIEQPEDGSPVAVISTDPQASSVWWSKRVEKASDGVPFDFDQAHGPDQLRAVANMDYAHIFVDTPGSLVEEDTLVEELELCSDVLVPMEPEPLAFEPTQITIETLRAAEATLGRPIRYRVVVNNWDPRDGTTDLKETSKYIRRMGWPFCNTIVRHYKLHTRASADGKVVTQYPKNRVAMEAREDFYRLALELGYGPDPAWAATRTAATVAA